MFIYANRRVGIIIALFKIVGNSFRMIGGLDERMYVTSKKVMR